MSFDSSIERIGQDLAQRMTGVRWHAQLPGGFVGPTLEELRLVRVTHWSFALEQASGEIVVAASVASDIAQVFAEMYEARFPIEKVRLIHHYGGSDEQSMADNNSSGFNSRVIAGTSVPSLHALGLAVDINPVQNPYVVADGVLPRAGAEYLDRDNLRPGMISADGPVVKAFDRIGWEWGGLWSDRQDFHHFQRRSS